MRNSVGGPGSYSAICDVCGFKFKASELIRRWDGAMVDKACWEPRHPQDFIRAKQDNVPLPFVRPDTDGPDLSPTINCNAWPEEFMTNHAFMTRLNAWADTTSNPTLDIYNLRTYGGSVTIPDGITVRVNCTWTVDG